MIGDPCMVQGGGRGRHLNRSRTPGLIGCHRVGVPSGRDRHRLGQVRPVDLRPDCLEPTQRLGRRVAVGVPGSD